MSKNNQRRSLSQIDCCDPFKEARNKSQTSKDLINSDLTEVANDIQINLSKR